MADPSTQVQFSRLPSGIPDQQFNGPGTTPTQPKVLPMFGMGRTAGLTLYSWQLADKAVSIWPLVLEVTREQYTTLSELFHRHLKGPSTPFNYRHTDGKTYPNVRWVETEFVAKRIDPDTYQVNLTLQIEDVHVGDPASSIL